MPESSASRPPSHALPEPSREQYRDALVAESEKIERLEEQLLDARAQCYRFRDSLLAERKKAEQDERTRAQLQRRLDRQRDHLAGQERRLAALVATCTKLHARAVLAENRAAETLEVKETLATQAIGSIHKARVTRECNERQRKTIEALQRLVEELARVLKQATVSQYAQIVWGRDYVLDLIQRVRTEIG